MGRKKSREEPLYRRGWVIGLLGIAVTVLGVLVAVLIYVLQSRDSAHVEFIPEQTRIVLHEGDGQKHIATLSLLSKGNRGTVVREIRLVDPSGQTIRAYRGAPLDDCDPQLPIRLDAPDERVVTLRISATEEARLHRIEVDAIEGAKPIAWRYVRMAGRAEGHGGAFGTLTVTPPPPSAGATPQAPGDTAKSGDEVVDEVIPAKKGSAEKPPPAPKPTKTE